MFAGEPGWPAKCQSDVRDGPAAKHRSASGRVRKVSATREESFRERCSVLVPHAVLVIIRAAGHGTFMQSQFTTPAKTGRPLIRSLPPSADPLASEGPKPRSSAAVSADTGTCRTSAFLRATQLARIVARAQMGWALALIARCIKAAGRHLAWPQSRWLSSPCSAATAGTEGGSR
jgi:hypothetical protein